MASPFEPDVAQDNTLFEEGDTLLSSGIGSRLFAGATAGSNNALVSLPAGLRRGLLQFDLGSIPSGALITTATLTLAVVGGAGSPSIVALHRVTSSWGEETGSNATNASGGGGALVTTPSADATWTRRFHTDPAALDWGATGGDFVAFASATTTVSGGGGGATATWASSAGTVADVQAWVLIPADNHGWILIGDEATLGSAKVFASRENAVADVPRLVVQFTLP